MHFHKAMLLKVRKNLLKIIKATEKNDLLVFVGLPLMINDSVYNCAAAISDGKVLGFIPKENVKESRFCHPSETIHVVLEDGYEADLNKNLIFAHNLVPELRVSVMLGQDIYGIISPGARHALAGATVLACLADFPQTATSLDRAITAMQVDSRRMSCGMILAAPPYGESTTDHSFSGLTLVGEAGQILDIEEGKESESLIELDVDYLRNIRLGNEEFRVVENDHTVVGWGEEVIETSITRLYSKNGDPFSLLKDKNGTFLGIFKNKKYTDYEVTLVPGDTIFLYTDGVTEAMITPKEQFGKDMMLAVLNQDTHAKPEELLKKVHSSVLDFMKGAEQFDDITMLCLRYNGVHQDSCELKEAIT